MYSQSNQYGLLICPYNCINIMMSQVTRMANCDVITIACGFYNYRGMSYIEKF